MAKIKIEDLQEDQKVSMGELRNVWGGALVIPTLLGKSPYPIRRPSACSDCKLVIWTGQ